MKKRPTPLSVSCPQCRAEVGVHCWSGTRRGHHLKRGFHEPRLRRADGEQVPDDRSVYLKREIDRVVRETILSCRASKEENR